MKSKWTLDRKYELWLTVALSITEVKSDLGLIPFSAHQQISTNAAFSVSRITEFDEGWPKDENREAFSGFNHDMHAFTETCKEAMKNANVSAEVVAQFMKDVTSYDVEDSAFVLQIVASSVPIREALVALRNTLYVKACENHDVPMMELTHGQAAEIITVGLKLLNYVDMIERDIENLDEALEKLKVGRLAGAVGSYGHLGPEVERRVCQKLGLKPVRISTQIIHRDRHAKLMNVFAVIAGNIEHIAQNLWAMCQFPRMEAREKFTKTQRGSTQMPQKRNPITLERLMGLAKVIRGYAVTMLELIQTRDARDISQSGPERIIWPDATTLLHYMLFQLEKMVKGIEFFPQRMASNIALIQGIWASSYVKDLLLENGCTEYDYSGERQETYKFVQSCAFESWDNQVPFAEVLRQHQVLDVVGEAEFDACFSLDKPLRYIGEVFERFVPLAA